MLKVQYNNEYKNDYGIINFSDSFLINGIFKTPTKKFNKTTVGVRILNKNTLDFLKNEDIKVYGSDIVFIEVKENDDWFEPIDGELYVNIKKFKNLKGETFNKLVYNNKTILKIK